MVLQRIVALALALAACGDDPRSEDASIPDASSDAQNDDDAADATSTPSLTFFGIAEGARVCSRVPIDLTARAVGSSRLAQVEVFVDGESIGIDRAFPWSVTFDAAEHAEGAHVLGAVATDDEGREGTAELTLVVANEDTTCDHGPTVTITSPIDGVRSSDSALRVRADVTDDSGVNRVVFTVDGEEVGRLNAAPYEQDVPLRSHGVHHIGVEATDTAGHTAFAEIEIYADRNPPDILLAHPLPTELITGDFEVSFEVTDDSAVQAVSAVVTLGDGRRIEHTFDAPPYRHTFPSAPCASVHVLVTAEDAFGNAGASGLTTLSSLDACDVDCDGFRAAGSCGGADCDDRDLSVGDHLFRHEYLELGDIGVARYLAMTVDAVDRTVLAYSQSDERSIHFQRGAAHRNVVGNESTAPRSFGELAMALDRNGRGHVVYRRETPDARGLVYATNAGGEGRAFIAEVIETGDDVGVESAIAIDAEGRAHVAYYRASDGALRYAVREGGSFTIETVDGAAPEDDAGRGCDLALDPEGRPHLSYFATRSGLPVAEATYLRREGDAWMAEAIGTGTGYTSIALDTRTTEAIPRVIYGDGSAVRHAVRASDGWHVDTIEDAEGPLDLALDAEGRSRFLGYETTDLGVDLDYFQGAPGEDFERSRIATMTGGGRGASALALDSRGEVRATFQQQGEEEGEVRYTLRSATLLDCR